MNLRVPENTGKFLRAAQLAVSQEGLSSMQLVINIKFLPSRNTTLPPTVKENKTNEYH
jgi:hypothetical protein